LLRGPVGPKLFVFAVVLNTEIKLMSHTFKRRDSRASALIVSALGIF